MDLVDSYPRKSHIHGKHYRCTFSAKGRGHLAIDFWSSYADEEFNALGSKKYQMQETIFKYADKGRQAPTPYDVIACIQKSEVGTFDDFCSDFGYDSDSRKAEETYHAVVREWRKVQKFFTEAELVALQEVQ